MIFINFLNISDPPGRNKVDYTARLFMPAVFFLFVFVYIVATIPGTTFYNFLFIILKQFCILAWAVKYL